ncbi:MAG: hypothetical protein APF83_12335 [Lutibacter sp. BRH_c52]|nr:MAG: hypothetical protein APF83_12335 [Lutibacter sp. BRH_c52]
MLTFELVQTDKHSIKILLNTLDENTARIVEKCKERCTLFYKGISFSDWNYFYINWLVIDDLSIKK